jgi:hypothetical protein
MIKKRPMAGFEIARYDRWLKNAPDGIHLPLVFISSRVDSSGFHLSCSRANGDEEKSHLAQT